ncbi:MAG: hypothetical protein ABIP53_09945, partial [Candidatus Limnocylindrales bacterium]
MSAVFFDSRAFSDRVMAAVATEPTPTVTGAFRRAVAQLDVRAARSAVATAWHLATFSGAPIRRPLRIRSAVFLAGVMFMLAIGTTLAAAGAAIMVHS